MIKLIASTVFVLALAAGVASASPATPGDTTNGVVGGSGVLFDNSN